MVLATHTGNGHATNVLAVDLARENERLRARVAELEAQLEAMIPNEIALGDQVIDLRTGLIRRNGKVVAILTPNERSIMRALAAAPGVTVPYERIADVTWPGYQLNKALRHTMRVNLSRLRLKLGDLECWVHGRGSRSRYFRVDESAGVALLI